MNDEPPPLSAVVATARPPVASRGPRRRGAAAVAAAALAAGMSVRDAAAEAGVGRRTLTRWQADPKFAARVEALRAGGRVVRDYFGVGEFAESIARLHAADRERRRAERACDQFDREALADLDARLGDLCELADLVTRAALLATGHHQHHRGDWRKRRVSDTRTD